MHISFEVKHDESYYVATWHGRVTDAYLVEAYTAFFDSEDWVPGHNSFVDLSEFDPADISPTGLRALAALVESRFTPHNFRAKIAVYAPHDLPYGLSRMYSVDVDSFETHRSFREKDKALAWLLSGD